MNNTVFKFDEPKNEKIYDFSSSCESRAKVLAELEKQSKQEIEIPIIIDGKEIRTGKTAKVTMPHDHKHVIATYHMVTEKEVQMAIDAASRAKKEWLELSWVERASITLKAADLLSLKYRFKIDAAT